MEERNRVNYLLELEQSNVISFNDLEYEVASKVNVPDIIGRDTSRYCALIG